MAYIKVIHPDQAKGMLEQDYQRVRGPAGQVDNVLQIHSLRPHTLEGHMALYKAVLHHPGNSLPKWFLESIGVLVSLLNDCSYCVAHHRTGLKRLLAAEPDFYQGVWEQLQSRSPGAPFNAAQRQALDYVHKLTLEPGSVNAADVSSLREQGFSDGEILEINQVASYFAYANRTVVGLGVSADGEKLGLSPVDSSDPNNWNHS